MILVDQHNVMRRSRIVIGGVENLQQLEESGKATKPKHPSAQSFCAGDMRHVKIQRQLGGDSIVPNSIVVFRELLIEKEIDNNE